jgi:hypothetical protein
MSALICLARFPESNTSRAATPAGGPRVPGRCRHSGIRMRAAAAEPANGPTLEDLCLSGHPAIGAGTAAALATAPFRHVSQLSLTRAGALQLDVARAHLSPE